MTVSAPTPAAVSRDLLPLCAAAEAMWQPLLPKPSSASRTVLVELMAQDIRVTLRNLTVANSIRQVTGAKLVAVIGVDREWAKTIWKNYLPANQVAMAKAFGACEVIDVHQLVDDRLNGLDPEVSIDGVPLRRVPVRAHPAALADIARASTVRILKVPRLTDEIRSSPTYRHVIAMTREFSALYDALLTQTNACAVVTSHVDYTFWGTLVESARRARVPVTHVQTTGSVKAYTLFPEHDTGQQSFRAALTDQIGDYFNHHLLRHRDTLRRSAELATARSRSNHGMPSWWRGGGTMSALEIRTAAERRALRAAAATRFDFDAARPTIGVYNHAISDALNTNVEAFEDLGAWFERTAEFAADHPQVNWLFLDHPSQVLYDDHGFFDSVAARFAEHGHMAFTRSMQLSKNVIFSLVDLGLTTRGSVSNELPAFGIPAIQAGWSEWSRCGLSTVADTPEKYWQALQHAITELLAERPLITRDQIERARLWLWFYRSGADVPSNFVPHWSVSERRALIGSTSMTTLNVPPDADPALIGITRMWRRRQPILTRVDFSAGSAMVTDALGLVEPTGSRSTSLELGPVAFHSDFDEVAETLPVPGRLTSGSDPRLGAVDWIMRGEAIIGRVTRPKSLLGVRVAESAADYLSCTVTIGRDAISDGWWDRHVKDRTAPAGGRHRIVQVRILDRPPELVSVMNERVDVTTVLSRSELDHGLLVVELSSPPLNEALDDVCLPSAAVGVQILAVDLRPIVQPIAAPGAKRALLPAFLSLGRERALVSPSADGEPVRIRTVALPNAPRRAARAITRMLGSAQPFHLDLEAIPLLENVPATITGRGVNRRRPGIFIELTADSPTVLPLDQLPRLVGTRWAQATAAIPELA